MRTKKKTLLEYINQERHAINIVREQISEKDHIICLLAARENVKLWRKVI